MTDADREQCEEQACFLHAWRIIGYDNGTAMQLRGQLLAMVYMRYITVTRDAQARRQLFASHRVVCIALWSLSSPRC